MVENVSSSSQRPPSQGGAARVLVIEDNADVAEAFGLLLETVGHEVVLAYAGGEGVDEARRFRPDVVICDIGLPGRMDGYDVARAMRADPALAGCYLIALTGHGQDEDRARVREAGFDAHVLKPTGPDELQRAVDQGLRARRAPAAP